MKKVILSVLVVLIGLSALAYAGGYRNKSKVDMLIFCENTAKNMLKHPDSYKRHEFHISMSDSLPSGANKKLYSELSEDAEYLGYKKTYPTVYLWYKAKNSFAMESKGLIVCEFDSTKDENGTINKYIRPVSVSSGNQKIENSSDDADKIYAWSKYSDSSFSVKNRMLSSFYAAYYLLANKIRMDKE